MPDVPALAIADLRVEFPSGAGRPVPVVRGACWDLAPGRTLGLVGESGSGKSMTALALAGLVPYPGSVRGNARLGKTELTALDEAAWRGVRGSRLGVVFQDPGTALNPVLPIGLQIAEILTTHRGLPSREALARAEDLLREVGIARPDKRLRDYPHQLSGGMKQRVLIAMALACDPEVLILDEPTTALDVTVQAQILDLIESVQSRTRVAVLLISHDVAVVSEIADAVAVMYAGRVVERLPVTELLRRPRHPYTRALIDAVPALRREPRPLRAISGHPPDPFDLPDGCPFHPRCPRSRDDCRREDPPWQHGGEGGWACWHPWEAEA